MRAGDRSSARDRKPAGARRLIGLRSTGRAPRARRMTARASCEGLFPREGVELRLHVGHLTLQGVRARRGSPPSALLDTSPFASPRACANGENMRMASVKKLMLVRTCSSMA